MVLILRLDDEHDHRELRVIGDASDALAHVLKHERFAELGPLIAKLRAQHLHRAITLCLESAQTEVVAQRVIGNERVERSPFPNNLLARGSENLGERGGFSSCNDMPSPEYQSLATLGLATVQFAAVEVDATVTPFDNGLGCTLVASRRQAARLVCLFVI